MKLHKSICNPTAIRLLGALFFAALERMMGPVPLLLLFLKQESIKQMLLNYSLRSKSPMVKPRHCTQEACGSTQSQGWNTVLSFGKRTAQKRVSPSLPLLFATH